MIEVTKTSAVVGMLLAAAVAAPSAGARTADQPLPARVAPSPVTRTVEVRSNGFDWADAGLGAAGMLSLVSLGTGAVVIGRRTAWRVR